MDNMLTEAMASAALATATMGNNQTNGESILRVELRKLRDLFAKDSQRIQTDLEAKMEAEKVKMENSNSALWQENDQRLGQVERVQKQVQNQLERLDESAVDGNVLSTEVMKIAKYTHCGKFQFLNCFNVQKLRFQKLSKIFEFSSQNYHTKFRHLLFI